MLHDVHEIINTLGVCISLIEWRAVISMIDSGLKFGASWLDYLTASKLAKGDLYQSPVPTSSRRRNPIQHTRVRKRKHKSSI